MKNYEDIRMQFIRDTSTQKYFRNPSKTLLKQRFVDWLIKKFLALHKAYRTSEYDKERFDKLCRNHVVENKELREALQYLVDTKKLKDTDGKTHEYIKHRRKAWTSAEQLLNK